MRCCVSVVWRGAKNSATTTAKGNRVGISNVMVHWFERLAARDVFAGKHSILEMGPQDLVVTKAVIYNFLQSVSPSSDNKIRLDVDFFENGQLRPFAMRAFYATLGLQEYKSLDLTDQRADFRLDMNEPLSLPRTFDVVTNFGTLEHVFNVANVARAIHDHLNAGGLALHVLPTRGDYNHGFYNLHSTWFRDLADANGYEVVDIVLIPDFGGQHVRVGAQEKMGDIPPRRSTMIDIREADPADRDEDFARTVALRLLRRRLWPRSRIDSRIYDYIFAAFRKVSNAAFVYPQQGQYAVSKI